MTVMSHDSIAKVASFSVEQLGEIANGQSAIELLASVGVVPESVSEYGHGFVLTDKAELVTRGKLLLIQWRFSTGDHGDMVTVFAMTEHGDKVMFVDGSTGVFRQLQTITDKRSESRPDTATMGLVASLNPRTYQRKDDADRPMTDDKGRPLMATTYYLV